MSANETPACSVNLCPNAGTYEETAQTQHWRFIVHYCHEHHRELENGTPLGPLGLDCTHVTIEPLGTTELKVPAMQPSPSA
jgi:hypothetical protein